MPNEDNVIDAEIVEESDSLPVRYKVDPSNYEPLEPSVRREAELEANEQRRCTAHSSRTGERCRKWAVLGTEPGVCATHGASAPQVKRKARERLEEAADRMAAHLLGLAENAASEAIQLGATNSALDRAGLKAPSEVVLSQADTKPYEEVFDSIATGTRAESRAARGLPDLPASAEETLGRHAPSSTQGETGDQTQPPTPSPPWAGTFETGPPPQAFDTYTTGHINDGTGWPDTPPQQPSAHKFARERGNQAANGVTREPPVRHTPSGQAREDSAATRPHHISGDDAVAEAGRLARQQKAITSPHRRYTRP